MLRPTQRSFTPDLGGFTPHGRHSAMAPRCAGCAVPWDAASTPCLRDAQSAVDTGRGAGNSYIIYIYILYIYDIWYIYTYAYIHCIYINVGLFIFIYSWEIPFIEYVPCIFMYFPFPRPGPGGSPMADPGSRAMGGIHGKDGGGTRWTPPSQPLGVQQNWDIWSGHLWVPSGKHTKSYWKWPLIVSFPMKNGDFP